MLRPALRGASSLLYSSCAPSTSNLWEELGQDAHFNDCLRSNSGHPSGLTQSGSIDSGNVVGGDLNSRAGRED